MLAGGNISQSRFRGYAEALRGRNFTLDTSLIGGGEFTQEGAQRAMLDILAQHPPI